MIFENHVGKTPFRSKGSKGGSSKKIHDPVEYDIKEFDPESGYKNFAVLLFSFKSLEYLYLKRSGHRRAIHTWDSALDSNWLVP